MRVDPADNIDAIVQVSEAQTGVLKGGRGLALIRTKEAGRSAQWTEDEEAFLTEHLGKLSLPEISRALSRTIQGVRLHFTRDLHLTVPSKRSDILTAEHVSMGLNLDGHGVHRLTDRGILPCRLLPFCGQRKIRVIDRVAFMGWLLDPKHWCYFKPESVGGLRSRGKRGYTGVYDYAFWAEARTVLLKKFKAWPDKWLTPVQAAELLGMRPSCYHNINRAIHTGTLKATRWGNWWILRSDLPKGFMFNVYGQKVTEIRQNKRRGRHVDEN